MRKKKKVNNIVERYRDMKIFKESFGSVRSPIHWPNLRKMFGRDLLAIVKIEGIDEYSVSEHRWGVFVDVNTNRGVCYKLNLKGDTHSPDGVVYRFASKDPLGSASKCAVKLARETIDNMYDNV